MRNKEHPRDIDHTMLQCIIKFSGKDGFYFILLRTVLLLWGVNKFTKKLREADPIPTNEIDNLVKLYF